METNKTTNPRRQFLEKLAVGATAITLAAVSVPINTIAEPVTALTPENEVDKWFDKIKGKHKMVFDATHPHELFPFAWPKVFLNSNEKTGTPPSECGVVVVLRHAAISYAFEDRLWEKYKFGEVFKADDPLTKAPANRNPFWKPKAGDFKIPGVGPVQIGINELQEAGVLFCVCATAITVYSTVVAGNLKAEPDTIKKDWMAGLLPDIQVVPSGVLALGRAQEKGCAYCFTG